MIELMEQPMYSRPSVYEKETLRWSCGRIKGGVFSDLVFRRCYFEGGGMLCDSPSNRTIIRNVELERCEQRGGALCGVILEDILVTDHPTCGI
jgi:hypothetical protein